MNQLPRWILCAALCCAVSACDSGPDKTGIPDPASSTGSPDPARQAVNEVNKPKDVPKVAVDARPEPPKALKPPSDVARPPKDAKRTRLGVHYKVLKKGTGTQHPKPTDRIEVHYSGWTTNGRRFDSSVVKGQPLIIGMNEAIPGWTDGLQTMVVGEKTRFWISEGMAYRGQPYKPRGMLVFDVELLRIH